MNLDRRAPEGEGPLSENERDELNRLRRENAELAMEITIDVLNFGGLLGQDVERESATIRLDQDRR